MERIVEKENGDIEGLKGDLKKDVKIFVENEIEGDKGIAEQSVGIENEDLSDEAESDQTIENREIVEHESKISPPTLSDETRELQHEVGLKKEEFLAGIQQKEGLNTTDSDESCKSTNDATTVMAETLSEDIVQVGKSMKPAELKPQMPSGCKSNQQIRPTSLKAKITKANPLQARSARSVSSIDINITRIIEGDVNDSVAMEFLGGDEVDQELALAVSNDDAISVYSDLPGGRAAATNTPVESHLRQGTLRTPVRDNIYEHALHLIKNRCCSRTTSISSRYPLPTRVSNFGWEEAEEDLVSLPILLSKINEPPFKSQPNKSFFIAQHHPIPLEPLKVWKGYHGNVFFQPLICRKMKMSVPDKIPINAVNSTVRKGYSSTSLSAKNCHFPRLGTNTRNLRATTAKTWNGSSNLISADPRGIASAAVRPGTRQMSVLDRSTVFSEMDQRFGDDISWLNDTEALGTLQIGTGQSRSSAHFYDNRVQHYKMRIRRGLVSHNQAKLMKEDPTLDVNGGHIKDNAEGTWRDSYQRRTEQVLPNSPADESRFQKTWPYENQGTTNGRHVVVDLMSENKIVKEYLVEGGLNTLIDEKNTKVVK